MFQDGPEQHQPHFPRLPGPSPRPEPHLKVTDDYRRDSEIDVVKSKGGQLTLQVQSGRAIVGCLFSGVVYETVDQIAQEDELQRERNAMADGAQNTDQHEDNIQLGSVTEL